MPRLPFPAAFLIERWGLEDEIAGNIVEEYQSGRSRTGEWSWKAPTRACGTQCG